MSSAKNVKTLQRARGLAHDLIVTKEGRTITLWSEAGIRHTVFDSTAPHLPGLEYARNMLAALAFCPQAQSCLVLGLGGGSIPRMLLAARPQIHIDAVEVDPAIVELAARYFDIRALPRFTLHLEDAAAFLERCTSRYGIVIIDTYVGERLPDQCATREFLECAGNCLDDEGVLAVNWLNGDSRLQKELLMNLEAVIGPVWLLRGLKSLNLLYFAAPRTTTRPALVSAAEAVGAEIPFENSLKRLAQRLRRPG